MDDVFPLERHDPLVRWWAAKLVSRILKGPIEDTDEYADGWLGLIRASQKYDSSRGVEFSTYASHAIRNRIRQGQAVARTKRRGGRGDNNDATPVRTINIAGIEREPLYFDPDWIEAEADRDDAIVAASLLPELPLLEFAVVKRVIMGNETCGKASLQLGVSEYKVQRLVAKGLKRLKERMSA